MTRSEATEFEYTITPTDHGEWEWRVRGVNGSLPEFMTAREGWAQGGKTMTRWGAGRAARRKIKYIKRRQRLGTKKFS